MSMELGRRRIDTLTRKASPLFARAGEVFAHVKSRSPFKQGIDSEQASDLMTSLDASAALLNQWGGEWAVAGYTALSLWTGEFTRATKDLDIVIPEASYPNLSSFLSTSGYVNLNEMIDPLPDPASLIKSNQHCFIKTDAEQKSAAALDIFLLKPSTNNKHFISPLLGVPVPIDFFETAYSHQTREGTALRFAPPEVVLFHKVLGARYARRSQDRKDIARYVKKLTPEQKQTLQDLLSTARPHIPKDFHPYS